MNLKMIAVAIALLLANYLATVSVAQETEAQKTIKPKEMIKDTKEMTLVDQKSSHTNAPEWTKFTVPNEMHKALDAIAGKFTYKSKYWMAPKGKPLEDSGTSETKWIMDGRYLQQDFEGKMEGKPFNGMAITGYDILRKEYQSVWIDSLSTGMWISQGKGDKKSFTTTGTGTDPMTNDPQRYFKAVTKIVNNNEHTYEMYAKDKDGKEFRTMEIRFKRVR